MTNYRKGKRIPDSFPDLYDLNYHTITFLSETESEHGIDWKLYHEDIEKWFKVRDKLIRDHSEHNDMIMKAKEEEGDYIDTNYYGGKRDGLNQAWLMVFQDAEGIL